MSLGGTLLTLSMIVQGIAFLGVLAFIWKALTAYRQHDSRPMLLLATGLLLLLLAPNAVEMVGTVLFEGTWFSEPLLGVRPSLTAFGSFVLLEELLRLSGIAALLASLYVRDRPSPG